MKYIFVLLILYFLMINCFAQFSIYLSNQISINSEKITSIKISKDGRFLAYGLKEGEVCIWDINAKRILHRLNFHKKEITSLAFDSSNQHLISGSKDKKIVIWDLYSGDKEKIIKDFKAKIKHLELSPDDRTLAVCGGKKEITLYEFPLGEKKGDLKGCHKKDIIYITYNLNGDQLVSVGKDNQMIFWDPSQLKLIRKNELSPNTINGSGIEVRSARASFDKYLICIGYQERKLAKGGKRMIFKYNMAFYEWKTGREIEILEGNNKDIDFLSITPDKNYIITDNSTLRNKKISFWNLQKGIIEQNYSIDGNISAIEVSENGNWLAASYTQDQQLLSSYLNVFQLSGIEGFERFSYDNQIRKKQVSGFGSSIQITTPSEPIINFGERKKLAVIYFDNLGVPEDIAKTTTYLLESKLGNSPQIDLIERNQIEKVISEMKYQLSGLTTSDAVEIGKQLNAEYILLGSINKLGNILIITAKLVNVETAQIEGTREVQCSNATIEDISNMISSLAPTITKF